MDTSGLPQPTCPLTRLHRLTQQVDSELQELSLFSMGLSKHTRLCSLSLTGYHQVKSLIISIIMFIILQGVA